MTQANLQEMIDAWMHTPDWEASVAYMREHGATLLSDAAEDSLRANAMESPETPEIVVHADLLAACRAQGIDAGYESVLSQMAEAQDEALLNALLDVRDSSELAQFAQTLTVGGLDRLVELGDDALTGMQGNNASALQQRLAALKAVREQINSPLWHGIRDYLDAATDQAAEAVLTAQPALLLTNDAEAALDSMEGANKQAQTRLVERRSLWRRIRALTTGA
ncbi:MAG: hypothetical protein HZB53_21475 [Chloroflexi bacterium]|nr:hypothetical protein [Chloroflexota bacterium]